MTETPDRPLSDDDITTEGNQAVSEPHADHDADGVDQGQDADGVDLGQDADTQDHGGGQDTDSTDGVDADGTDSAS